MIVRYCLAISQVELILPEIAGLLCILTLCLCAFVGYPQFANTLISSSLGVGLCLPLPATWTIENFSYARTTDVARKTHDRAVPSHE